MCFYQIHAHYFPFFVLHNKWSRLVGVFSPSYGDHCCKKWKLIILILVFIVKVISEILIILNLWWIFCIKYEFLSVCHLLLSYTLLIWNANIYYFPFWNGVLKSCDQYIYVFVFLERNKFWNYINYK